MDVSTKPMFRKVLNAWNSGNPDELIKLCTDYIVYEHTGSDYLVIRGKQEFKTYLTELLNSIKNMHFEYYNTSWNDPVFFAEWGATGMLTGKRYGVEGNNTPIKFSGVFAFILDHDGKIVEQRTYYNDAEIVNQVKFKSSEI